MSDDETSEALSRTVVTCASQPRKLHERSAVGPGGARVTRWYFECLSCGNVTSDYVSQVLGSVARRFLGSVASVSEALDVEMETMVCPRPRCVPESEAWLDLVYDHARMGAPPSLRFVVAHHLAESIPEVTARAWRDCESGYAMGRLALLALSATPGRYASHPHRNDEWTDVIVNTFVGDVCVTLCGPDRDVARQLRVLLPQPPPIAGWTVPIAPERRA